MKHFLRKTVSLLLALLIIFPVFTSSAYTTDDVIKASTSLIFSNEGTYTTVNKDDNGAISIGALGWHADRALSLLKTIISKNEENALLILGEELYNEITTASDWNYRIFNDAEAECVSALLGTQEGTDVQNDLAYTDIKVYVNHGLTLGITDGKVLVYFADLENQMGSQGAQRVANAAIAIAESADKVTLDDIFKAAMEDETASGGPTRRNKSYNYCLELDLDNLYESGTYRKGDYVTTASLLCVRSGPSTAYDTVTSDLKRGTNVTVTQISGEWGQITVNGVTGWICLRYADLIKAEEITVTVLGDVTGNDKIETADARLILRYCVSLEIFSESQIKCSDVDGNGSVTTADARITLRVAAGLETL